MNDFSSKIKDILELHKIVATKNTPITLFTAVDLFFRKHIPNIKSSVYYTCNENSLSLTYAKGTSQIDPQILNVFALDTPAGWVMQNKKALNSQNWETSFPKIPMHFFTDPVPSLIYLPILTPETEQGNDNTCLGVIGFSGHNNSIIDKIFEKNTDFIGLILNILLLGLREVQMSSEIKTETRFQGLLNSSLNNIASGLILLKNSPPHYNITYINEPFRKILGIPKSHLDGESLNIIETFIGGGKSIRQIVDIMELSLKGKTITTLKTKDGNQKWMQWNLSPVSSNKIHSDYWAIIVDDITESIHYQNELLQLKIKSDQANAAKSKFLANMSHELRTPLNAISGSLHFLSESITLDHEQSQWVAMAQSATKTILSLVNDVLDLAKIDMNKFEYQEQDIDLEKILVETMFLFKAEANKAKINLELIIDPNIKANHFRIDPLRFQQLLLNLIGNAIKFNKENGKVSVSFCIESEHQNNNTSYTLKISDTGLGMSEETQKRLFTPFEQGDLSSTKKYSGTGLGLSICAKIVEQMNSKIKVESILNKGTTVTISGEIKKSDIPQPEELNPIVSEKKSNQLSILIVDDTKDNLLLLNHYLTKGGYHVHQCNSVSEALVAYQKIPFDIVLTDLQMPELDGFDFLKLANGLKTGVNQQSSPPFIAVTGYAFAEDAEKCAVAGFASHLAKPFTKSALFNSITKALELKEKSKAS